MKKIICLFLLLLGFFGAEQVWAQARVFNSTNEKIVVSDLKNLNEIVINPKSSGVAMFLPSDGVAKFNLARYEGYTKVSLGEATRLAKKGKIALNDLSLNDGSVAQVEKAETKKVEKTKTVSSKSSAERFGSARTADSGSNESSQVSRPGTLPETELVLSNKSSYRLMVSDGVFKGFALASEQTSVGAKKVATGKITFSIYFDPEEDSISSGRNHRRTVVNKIVVQGQDTLYITDSDLGQISSGERIDKSVKNTFNINFQIVSTDNVGKLIPASSARKVIQLDLKIGLNNISVDYLTEEGLPVRTTLLLMVNDSKKPIVINRRSDADLESVNPEDIVFSGSD